MLYTLNLDENNYLLSIAHTQNDYFEIEDISSLDNHLNAYHLVDESLVLDEIKLAEIIAEETAKEEAERQAEQHKADIDEQTLRLAQMFVDMGVNVDDFLDRLDAQSLYTALMTDSLLPEGE